MLPFSSCETLVVIMVVVVLMPGPIIDSELVLGKTIPQVAPLCQLSQAQYVHVHEE